MKPRQIVLTLPNGSTTNVCAAQTTAGAGNFVINGSAAVGGTVTFATALALSLTSTGNISGVNFTFTGLDENGNSQTETIAGPNNNTVAGNKYWTVITQIAVNGAVGTNTSVGINASGSGKACSPAVLVDYAMAHFNVGVSVILSGTISVTVQETFDDIRDSSKTVTWQNTSLATQASTANASLTFPCVALRMIVASYTNAATATFDVVQGWN